MIEMALSLKETFNPTMLIDYHFFPKNMLYESSIRSGDSDSHFIIYRAYPMHGQIMALVAWHFYIYKPAMSSHKG